MFCFEFISVYFVDNLYYSDNIDVKKKKKKNHFKKVLVLKCEKFLRRSRTRSTTNILIKKA